MIELPKKYLEQGFSTFQKKEIELGFQHGLDEEQVDRYAKIEFDNLQMKQIRLAIEDGFSDVQLSTFSRSEIDWEMMEHARENIKNGNVIDETKIADLRRKNLKIVFIITGILIVLLLGGMAFFFSKDSLQQLFQKLELSFITEKPIEIEYGSGFNPQDYIKSYTKDKNVELVLPNALDTTALGKHTLTFTLKNKKKSISKELEVDVVDKESPVLKLKQYSLTLERGINTTFSCKTYIQSANDNVDGDLTKKVECSKFDSNKNQQEIQYSVKDSSGNSSKEILKLTLKEKEVVKPEEKIVYIKTPTNAKGHPIYPKNAKGVGGTDITLNKYFMFKDGYTLDSGYKACVLEGSKYGAYTCSPLKDKDGIYTGYHLTN
ncbi:hypothetical protein [Bulleidia sp. zg-1006]|uniref:hypothetical protein n=1 Tax=Bulleidia sp. zg-1006 TaxID=2806552 RepID=UPI00193A678B|nr:hypothetical protein [Bulleidia sp. zg-1006]QRG86930.1 hypothetical protein JOS54_01025 [Bulleidia sp. zg-1006]